MDYDDKQKGKEILTTILQRLIEHGYESCCETIKCRECKKVLDICNEFCMELGESEKAGIKFLENQLKLLKED